MDCSWDEHPSLSSRQHDLYWTNKCFLDVNRNPKADDLMFVFTLNFAAVLRIRSFQLSHRWVWSTVLQSHPRFGTMAVSTSNPRVQESGREALRPVLVCAITWLWVDILRADTGDSNKLHFLWAGRGAEVERLTSDQIIAQSVSPSMCQSVLGQDAEPLHCTWWL